VCAALLVHIRVQHLVREEGRDLGVQEDPRRGLADDLILRRRLCGDLDLEAQYGQPAARR